MSFPGSFSSQLSSIMEALLKAVVAEVTALVEDGAVELRLELQDRERQILEKERDIEERDRVIEELRAAVEELTARGEEAMSPAEEEDRGEQTESCDQRDWADEEEDTKPFVKPEPIDEISGASSEAHESVWPSALLGPSAADAAADAAAACSYDESPAYNPQESEEFSHLGNTDLPLDSLLEMNQEQFYPAQQHGFSLIPNRNNKGLKKLIDHAKRQKLAEYRCDQCGKAFTEKRRLVTHQSVHTGAKPYSCKKCGKKFSRRDNCVRHEKSDARCRDFLVK